MQIVQNGSFAGLNYLHTIDLADNDITTLQSKAFYSAPALTKLFIERNKLVSLAPDQLPSRNSLVVLQSDFYILCCYYTDAGHCTPKSDALSSCSRLMDNKGKLVITAFQCITIALANSVAIGWNLQHSNVEIVQLLNLHFADLLMGVSVLCLLSTDLGYGDRFMEIALIWKQHWLCLIIASLICCHLKVHCLYHCSYYCRKSITLQENSSMQRRVLRKVQYISSYGLSVLLFVCHWYTHSPRLIAI